MYLVECFEKEKKTLLLFVIFLYIFFFNFAISLFILLFNIHFLYFVHLTKEEEKKLYKNLKLVKITITIYNSPQAL